MTSPATLTSAESTSRMALATLLVGQSFLPTQTIYTIFLRSIAVINRHARPPLDRRLTAKIWERISPSRVEKVKRFFISEYSRLILKSFSDEQIDRMLVLQTTTGEISDSTGLLLRAYAQMNWSELDRSLTQRSIDLMTDCTPDIIAAVSDEGIKFINRGAFFFGSRYHTPNSTI